MDRNNPEYPTFKKHFWEWFDSQPLEKKKMFWGFKEDMAEANFYFTVWSENNREK